MTLHALQLTRRHRQELPRHAVVARRERHHGAALDDEDARLADRLGREGMLVLKLEAEDVAGHVESLDLAAAVSEDLVDADRSADHLVEVLGRFALAVDLLVAGEIHRCADHVDRIAQLADDGRRARLGRDGAAGLHGPDGRLRQHGSISLESADGVGTGHRYLGKFR